MGMLLGRPSEDKIVPVAPAFWNFFTDATGPIGQHTGRCRDHLLRWYDCLDAYGTKRGAKKCSHLYADFQECAREFKQLRRCIDMRNERERQWLMGVVGVGPEREKNSKDAPSYDIFLPGFGLMDP